MARIRRSADEAKQRILEAAERHLMAGGPEAVRIQAIARDLGITDAAVHHHFGNRENLLESLLRHGARGLQDRISTEVARWAAGEIDLEDFASHVLDTMERRGYARLFMWLAMSGFRSRGSGMFAPLADELRARRRTTGGDEAATEESSFLATLFVMCLVSEPLFGETVRRSVGLPAGRATTSRFRSWLLAYMGRLAGTAVPVKAGQRR